MCGGISFSLKLRICIILYPDYGVAKCVLFHVKYESHFTCETSCKICLGIHVKSYAIGEREGHERRLLLTKTRIM